MIYWRSMDVGKLCGFVGVLGLGAHDRENSYIEIVGTKEHWRKEISIND